MYRFVVMPPPGKGYKNRPQQIQIRKDAGVVRGQVHLPISDIFEFLSAIKPTQGGLVKSISELQDYIEGDESINLEEVLSRLQRYYALTQQRLLIEGRENVEGMR